MYAKSGRRVAREPASLEEFFGTVGVGLGPYSDLPQGVTVTFDLQGAGGGVWTLLREGEGEGMQVSRMAAAHPDCRLTCAVDDFRALLDGRLSSRRGFLEGRLEVEGDVGLVLRLERALARTGAKDPDGSAERSPTEPPRIR